MQQERRFVGIGISTIPGVRCARRPARFGMLPRLPQYRETQTTYTLHLPVPNALSAKCPKRGENKSSPLFLQGPRQSMSLCVPRSVRPRVGLASAKARGLFTQLLPTANATPAWERPCDRQHKFPILGKIMSGTSRECAVSPRATAKFLLSPHFLILSLYIHTKSYYSRLAPADIAPKPVEKGTKGSGLHPEEGLQPPWSGGKDVQKAGPHVSPLFPASGRTTP